MSDMLTTQLSDVLLGSAALLFKTNTANSIPAASNIPVNPRLG
jgi:hypothetical protein